MTRKNIALIALAAAPLLLGTTSCSDSFLNEKLYSSYGPGATDTKSIEAQLVGLYRIYAEIWGWSSNQGFVSCWQIGTDIASAGDIQGVERPFYQYAELNPENAGVSYLWEKSYEIINNANLVISALGDETNPAAVAEAKFFRAYAYNMLVTLWGDVPLVAESTSVPKTDYVRESVVKVDELIESDLTYAIANLPGVGKAVKESRANQDMARQLAGEVYLRMGMRDATYFKKAEEAVSPVIEGGNYSLIQARYGDTSFGGDYYYDMFRWGKQRRSEGNTEAIWTFEMEYARDVVGGTVDNPQHRRVWVPAFHKYSGMINADSLGGRGNGRLRLSNFVKYNLYTEGDIRNSNYNIRRILYYNKPGYSEEIGIDAKGFRVAKDKGVRNVVVKTGDRVIPADGDSLAVFYPYTTKWGGYDPSDDFGYAIVKDWPVMRLGETYLLRAEARFRQGNLSGASDDINVIRDRAFKQARTETGNSNLGKVTAAQMDINFILDERARELLAEENRRMTLVRTGMLDKRIPMNGDAVPGAPADKVITGFQDFNALLPIPLTEIQLNKDAELKQNPGYKN